MPKQNRKSGPRSTGKCKECGKDFKQARFWQRFCSSLCKNEFHKRETQLARAAWRKSGEEGRDRSLEELVLAED